MARTMLTLLFTLSFSGSLIIAVTLALCRIFRKNLSYKWQYYIWAAAIARLLLPFGAAENPAGTLAYRLQDAIHAAAASDSLNMPDASDKIAKSAADAESATNINSAEETESGKYAQSATNINSAEETESGKYAQSATSADPSSHTESATNTGSGTALPQNNSSSAAENLRHRSPATVKRLIIYILKAVWAGRKYLCVLWLLAAALLFLRRITIYQDFVRYVRAGSTPMDQIASLEALSKLSGQLGIRTAIDLWECPLISSPMLIGFLHPVIVLPDASLPEKQLYYTLLHELVHYKRMDMYYKWTAQLVLCIHWFNPLAYCMGRTVNRLCELSCDEAAAALLKTKAEQREYAAALLDAMAGGHSYQEPLASLTLNGNKRLLQERLESIMNPRTKTLPKRLLTVCLTAAVTAASFYSGGPLSSASGQPKPAEGTPAVSTGQNTNSGSRSTRSGSQDTDTHTPASAHSRSDEITPEQADQMALALTHKIWVWDWVAFFVPYMSDDGVKQLLPASKNAEWAGSKDMTTGKKIKFTKKQIKAARKNAPSKPLTCGDIDSHALLIMQSNGDWDCISFMLPYMSRRGIRAVTRCYNQKHGGAEKRAEDYFS